MNSFKNVVVDLQPGNDPETVASTYVHHNRAVGVQFFFNVGLR
jgi:hypothetical protein